MNAPDQEAMATFGVFQAHQVGFVILTFQKRTQEVSEGE